MASQTEPRVTLNALADDLTSLEGAEAEASPTKSLPRRCASAHDTDAEDAIVGALSVGGTGDVLDIWHAAEHIDGDTRDRGVEPSPPWHAVGRNHIQRQTLRGVKARACLESERRRPCYA